MTQKDNPPMREIQRMAQVAWEIVVRVGERKDEDPKVLAIQGSSNVPLEHEGSETPTQRSPAPHASQDHPSHRNNGAKGGKWGQRGRYTDGGLPNCLYDKSESGYIDSELFVKRFLYFIKYAVKERRPLLLIMDGHNSHQTLEVVEMALENGVILLCWPPHTSHVLQPLDVGIFGPLKTEFVHLALNICHFNNSFVLFKRDFGKVFRKAYEKSVEELHMKRAFKACGIVPLDSHAINSQRVMPAAIVVLPEDTTTTTSGMDTVVCEAGPSPLPAWLSAQAAAPPLHPLVASGDIPEDLADLLHPISYKK
ncbi:hypothetical protein SKAU_G00353460 [Synaphobranchus kaupii]|uniref:DDE-1 domain-containing protein n=1 Tax=Synaphobranchus kaupii TaxID=118154 RepID=A0A9Q1EL18_SYNKA|nr:hypothetical protein SKAU_G00353460 [Synaphobranchus kaupii]